MAVVLLFDEVILPEVLRRLVDGLAEAQSNFPIYGVMVALLLFVASLAWVYLRITFLFVELAIDAQTDLLSAWRKSRHHAPRLALISGLPCAVFLVFALLDMWALEEVPAWIGMVSVVLYALLSIIVAAYWIVATSFAYRDVTGWTPDQPPTASTAA